MRLVKATLARRVVVVAATVAAGALAACTEPPARAPQGADCALILVEPREPTVVRVTPDGALVDEGPCTGAACMTGSAGAWARRDGDDVVVKVGAQEARAKLDKTSPVGHLAHAGVVIGHDVAGIAEGTELRLIDGAGGLPARVPLPRLEAGERLVSLFRAKDTLSAQIAKGDLTRSAFLTAPPESERDAVYGEGDVVVAHLLANPTRVRFADGVEVPYTLRTTFVAAIAHGGVVLLRGSPHEEVLVSPSGTTRTFTDCNDQVYGTAAQWFLVNTRQRTIVALDPRTLQPAGFSLTPDARHDLAGALLPAGASVERTLLASRRGTMFITERVRTTSCTVEDRLHLVNTATKEIRTIASGEGMRMHPAFAGDAFRFVSAVPQYSAP